MFGIFTGTFCTGVGIALLASGNMPLGLMNIALGALNFALHFGSRS